MGLAGDQRDALIHAAVENAARRRIVDKAIYLGWQALGGRNQLETSVADEEVREPGRREAQEVPRQLMCRPGRMCGDEDAATDFQHAVDFPYSDDGIDPISFGATVGAVMSFSN